MTWSPRTLNCRSTHVPATFSFSVTRAVMTGACPMYLAAVEIGAAELAEGLEVTSCSTKWRDWPASTISHHGCACCEIAREWVLAIDHTQLGDAAALTGPRWLRQRYPWGPSP